MENLSKILHNLDQGNTNVTDTKKEVLDLFLVMLSSLSDKVEKGESRWIKIEHPSVEAQRETEGYKWALIDAKRKLITI